HDCDFKNGSDVTTEKGASPHAAVTKPEHRVEVQAWLTVVSLRDVAEQTQYSALLIDGNRLVSFGHQIKPSDLCAFERPDRRDRSCLDRLLIGKGRHSRKGLFALIQDQDECSTIVLGGEFRFHQPSRAIPT